ncbi:MAG: carboxypeptidase regulatory-like domain-containing protein [Phycisphaerae bacterium]|nr:carboxypeptidase regulatory-like domain-containing protein [Phycisphaerae bacterium]
MRSRISSYSVAMSEAGVVFVLSLLLVAATSGQEVQRGTGTIKGTVVDATPDCSPEKCEKLANCKSQEEATQVLREVLGGQPASGATVTVASRETKRTTVTDPHGRYAFTGLPTGPYTIYAVMIDSEGKPRWSAPRATQCDKTVPLVLHGEFITVSGRIVDPNGRPIVGAKVTGTLVPMSEVGVPETRGAVSGANGFYVLTGFEPVNLYRVAGYLNGGSLDAPGALQTQVEIRVQAEGFRQDPANVPRVPLIAETQLVPGLRLWKALAQHAATMGDAERWNEPQECPLPASRGNTITGIDIVLNL